VAARFRRAMIPERAPGPPPRERALSAGLRGLSRRGWHAARRAPGAHDAADDILVEAAGGAPQSATHLLGRQLRRTGHRDAVVLRRARRGGALGPGVRRPPPRAPAGRAPARRGAAAQAAAATRLAAAGGAYRRSAPRRAPAKPILRRGSRSGDRRGAGDVRRREGQDGSRQSREVINRAARLENT